MKFAVATFSLLMIAAMSSSCGTATQEADSDLKSPDPKIYVINTSQLGKYKLGHFTQGGREENGRWVYDTSLHKHNPGGLFYTFGPFLTFPGVGHVNASVKLNLRLLNAVTTYIHPRYDADKNGPFFETMEQCQATGTRGCEIRRGYNHATPCVNVDMVSDAGTRVIASQKVCGHGEQSINLPGTIFDNGLNGLEVRVSNLASSGYYIGGALFYPAHAQVEIQEIRIFGNWTDPAE